MCCYINLKNKFIYFIIFLTLIIFNSCNNTSTSYKPKKCNNQCSESGLFCDENNDLVVFNCSEDKNGCLIKEVFEECANNKVCILGQCQVKNCKSLCINEGYFCENNKRYECGNFNNDSCLEKKEAFCEEGYSCVMGKCKQDCIPTQAQEICDGIDNNCDGHIDEGLTPPAASKTQGVCINSVKECKGNQDWEDPAYTLIEHYESEETSCDGLDNDCDGDIDEGFDDTDGDNIADCIDTDDDNDGILDNGFSTGDGVYTIDVDGLGGNPTFDVYCDMTTDDGGWTLAFDDTSSSEIKQDISDNVKAITITEILVYPADSGAYSIIGIDSSANNLNNLFSANWIDTGNAEDDYYKKFSIDTGNHTTSVFICDDNDIHVDEECSGHQVNYSGTPNGLITFGRSNSSDFCDYGTCNYSHYANIVIRKMLVR